jgi:superfamily I DNA/RNA helicase
VVVCSSLPLFPAILGCARTDPPPKPLSNFAEPALNYYPDIYEVISEDLKNEGIETFQVGDDNYFRQTMHYKAVGDADVVQYAIRICKKDPNKIPAFDLILVDEYQDFNETKSEFVDLLAQKNEIVVVGDDDQALYGFKGSSPAFIRAKYDPGNAHWESFTLRFCSRCTSVVIEYFHSLVAQFAPGDPKEDDPTKKRIQKEFLCYAPDGEPDSKLRDSKANPKICLIKSCPVGMIATKILDELKKIVGVQKIKEVLIIGEARSCRTLLKMTARQLTNYGFKYVDLKGESAIIPLKEGVVNAYRFLAKDELSPLGWRILGNPTDAGVRQKHLRNAKTLTRIIDGTPSEAEGIRYADISLVEEEIESWETLKRERADDGGDADDMETLQRHLQDIEIRRGLLTQELKRAYLYLPPPLRNLDITVCNILNSKGLGADVVFLIGFDQGKFPSKDNPTDNEVYQMLVAVTRAKKRIYLVNTIGKKVSRFVDCLNAGRLDVMEVKTRPSRSDQGSSPIRKPDAHVSGS